MSKGFTKLLARIKKIFKRKDIKVDVGFVSKKWIFENIETSSKQ